MTGMTGQQYQRTITAFFDQEDEANRAVSRLPSAGIPRASINIVAGKSQSVTSQSKEEPGFWEALKDLFMPDEDRATYAEGLRRGGYVVTVRADAAHYEKAIDILDDEGTIDIDQRSETWRKEGWSGYVNRRPKLTPYRRATLTPLGAYWEQAAIERASNSAVASERLAVVRPGF
jgi:hypothetical protein